MIHSFGAGFPTKKANRWFDDHNKKSHQSEIDIPTLLIIILRTWGV